MDNYFDPKEGKRRSFLHALLATTPHDAVRGFMVNDNGPYFDEMAMGVIVNRYRTENIAQGGDGYVAELHTASRVALFWGDAEPEAIVPELLMTNGGDYYGFYRLPQSWCWYDARAYKQVVTLGSSPTGRSQEEEAEHAE